jgi:hypothetical protein
MPLPATPVLVEVGGAAAPAMALEPAAPGPSGAAVHSQSPNAVPAGSQTREEMEPFGQTHEAGVPGTQLSVSAGSPEPSAQAPTSKHVSASARVRPVARIDHPLRFRAGAHGICARTVQKLGTTRHRPGQYTWPHGRPRVVRAVLHLTVILIVLRLCLGTRFVAIAQAGSRAITQRTRLA